jgi:hypothetical protein
MAIKMAMDQYNHHQLNEGEAFLVVTTTTSKRLECKHWAVLPFDPPGGASAPATAFGFHRLRRLGP